MAGTSRALEEWAELERNRLRARNRPGSLPLRPTRWSTAGRPSVRPADAGRGTRCPPGRCRRACPPGREGGGGRGQRRLAAHGPNRLPARRVRGPLARFLAQFNNLLIILLLAAAGVAALLGHWLDAQVILLVVLVNAVLGFVQEGRAEKALDAIRELLSPQASVIRDGRRIGVPAERLVPGDLCLIEAGDRVPADLRLVRANALQIDEAMLTGEAVPAEKSVEPSPRTRRWATAPAWRSRARWRPRARAPASWSARVPGPRSARSAPCSAGRGAHHPAPAPDGGLRPPADGGGPGRRRRDLPLRRVGARLRPGRHVRGRGQPLGGGDPGGPADHPHRHARDRRAADGAAQRRRSASAGGRGAGLRLGHLLGQDRHADPERDDRPRGRHGRPPLRGDRGRLRAARRIPRRAVPTSRPTASPSCTSSCARPSCATTRTYAGAAWRLGGRG